MTLDTFLALGTPQPAVATVFIYGLNDPRTGKLRYIGKSTNPHRRFRAHLSDMSDCYRTRWIRSLLEKGQAPTLEILDEVPESQWEFWEREWIRWARITMLPLTNTTDGGDVIPNRTGQKNSPTHCKAISESKTGGRHPFFGKKQSAEHVAKRVATMQGGCGMNNPFFGQTHTAETKSKMRLAKLGRKLTSESVVKREETKRQRRAEKERQENAKQ